MKHDSLNNSILLHHNEYIQCDIELCATIVERNMNMGEKLIIQLD